MPIPEEVLAAARGPGAEPLHRLIANADLYPIMLAAYGWTESKQAEARYR